MLGLGACAAGSAHVAPHLCMLFILSEISYLKAKFGLASLQGYFNVCMLTVGVGTTSALQTNKEQADTVCGSAVRLSAWWTE